NPRIVAGKRGQPDGAPGLVVADPFSQPLLAAAALELIEALSHLRISQQLGQFLLDGINRIQVGRGHAPMVWRGRVGFPSWRQDAITAQGCSRSSRSEERRVGEEGVEGSGRGL